MTNTSLLEKHLAIFSKKYLDPVYQSDDEFAGRKEHAKYLRLWTKERIGKMDEDDFYEFMSRLWAMLVWGNKRYYVNKLLDDNGLKKIKNELINLLWGKDDIAPRWDRFRKEIKGFGPAMMSEVLCHLHPNKFIIWNRRAYTGFCFLGIEKLPVHDYQLTGKKYKELCHVGLAMLEKIKHSIKDATLLTLDYLIWDELQIEVQTSKSIRIKDSKEDEVVDKEAEEFIHNDVRDALENIGKYLGLQADTEIKVATGAKVDAIWEVTIGNMGRVIYVFEVQTKGSIDSLCMNLLKALNNPAVQGVVAVSDKEQLEKIKKEAEGIQGLRDKLKYWDFKEVLQVHEHLQLVNEKINALELVPDSFR